MIESTEKVVSMKTNRKRRTDMPDDNVITDFKPKAKGSKRGSRNEKIYESGLVPAPHQKLLNGMKIALSGDTKGELIFQRVLELVGISRTSALKMISYLEKYGYVRYEAKPKEHKINILTLIILLSNLKKYISLAC